MKQNVHYEFHHMGVPTDELRDGEVFSAALGMYTSDNPGRIRIQFHRFAEGSPLTP